MQNAKSRTVKLEEPIEFGSETISEITLRKPKAKHMKGFPLQLGYDEMLTLAGRLSGQPDSVIDELGIDDLASVLEAVGNFIKPGRKTGKTV